MSVLLVLVDDNARKRKTHEGWTAQATHVDPDLMPSRSFVQVRSRDVASLGDLGLPDQSGLLNFLILSLYWRCGSWKGTEPNVSIGMVPDPDTRTNKVVGDRRDCSKHDRA